MEEEIKTEEIVAAVKPKRVVLTEEERKARKIEYSRKYYNERKEKYRAYYQSYYQNNKEKMREYAKKRYEASKKPTTTTEAPK